MENISFCFEKIDSAILAPAKSLHFLNSEHFSLVFYPPSIRAGGGTNADEVLAKQFFGVRKCGTLSQDLEHFVFKM